MVEAFAEVRRARERYRAFLAADLPRNPIPAWRRSVRVWRALNVTLGARGLPLRLVRKLVVLADLAWLQGMMGAELPSEVVPGPGLRLSHGGRGCVLHPSVRIGDRFEMMHRVTIGVRVGDEAATIGDDVFVGSGAAILGPVHLADGTVIGANAVVLANTEPGASYGGVPARKLGGGPAAGPIGGVSP